MVNTSQITFPAVSGTAERKVYVYLPESYREDQQRRYPVLYMFDGHNLFFDSDATYGKSWGLAEYMDNTRTPMMIVGVECNHGEDNERLSEYSPFDFTDPKLGRFKGRGKETMDWFVEVLKPQIDREYRTLSGREDTFIGGSSMGGLMSLYAVLAYNEIFSGAAVLSPSVWVSQTKLNRLIREAKLHRDTVVYLSYGTQEIGYRSDLQAGLAKTVSQLMSRGVYLTSRVVPYGRHCEACWEEQIPFFMNTLLYGRN